MASEGISAEIAAALRGEGPAARNVAVSEGTSFDRVAVVVPDGVDAREIAAALAVMPVAAAGEGEDDVWDRLAAGVKRATVLKNQSLLIAAALSWRGRGRVVGPLNPDLLIRFGVSRWR